MKSSFKRAFRMDRAYHFPSWVTFLLGADDPEMRRIESIIRQHNLRMEYATCNGRRVHVGNAYEADCPDALKRTPANSKDKLVLIECGLRKQATGIEMVTIDHHRPGDPGYGKGPKEFWGASSIGQLYKLLDEYGVRLTPAPTDRLLAAMDHCFARAIQGECLEISPDEVITVKVHEIAAAIGVTETEVRDSINRYATYYALRTHLTFPEKHFFLGEAAVYDDGEDKGTGYSLQLLTAQVAAAMRERTVLFLHRDHPGGPMKRSLYGASPEAVTIFMEEWAPAHGLEKIYGVPERGYAGGYFRSSTL